MGWLVQLVEAQPAPGVIDRVGQVPVGDAGRDQALKCPGEFLAEPVRGGGLPVVELRAPAQGESGEKVIAVKPDSAVERIGPGPGGKHLEVGDIHPHPAGRERYRCPSDLQAAAHGRRGDRERAAQ